MPSTYSPDLRIELIANGEKTGTWGTITNDNLGVIIEDAISGLASVSVTTADQALTAQNGAVDQSRCAAVSLTTTTTAPFNVYVPPVTKLYVFINASAYVATIYCSSILGNTTPAGAGVSIPAGKSVLLRTDGTNVISTADYAPALALGTALPATSGGTDQSSYAGGVLLFASTTTNLSKLADVATGNALISGGVGVAPSYGKIGLTTHVSGALPAGNGGTGQATLTANNVLLGNGTSAVQTVAPGSSGNALVSNGTTWVSGPPVPSGTVVYYAANTPPTGYLKANGAVISRSTYAGLFAAIGTTFGTGDGSTTFGLPDLRGEFIRSWADNGGVDSGRAFGSNQAVQTNNLAAFQTTGNAISVNVERLVDNAGNYSDYSETGANDAGTGVGIRMRNRGVETRPTNVALLACIKF
jgi:microcystin-dependent protein